MAKSDSIPNRPIVVGIRFSKEEKSKIIRQAKANGITIAGIIRQVLKKSGLI